MAYNLVVSTYNVFIDLPYVAYILAILSLASFFSCIVISKYFFRVESIFLGLALLFPICYCPRLGLYIVLRLDLFFKKCPVLFINLVQILLKHIPLHFDLLQCFHLHFKFSFFLCSWKKFNCILFICCSFFANSYFICCS